MPIFKTDGVVVRRRDLGESDRLLTLFTRRFGKIKAVAKGCRKPRSRLAGHLEPLNVADFMLWRREGRELAIVSGADLKERHACLADSLPAFAAGQVAAELIDRSVGDDEPQPRLFSMFIQFLRALRRPEHAPQALLAFSVRAADALGYAVSLDRCADCGSRIANTGEAWLEYQLGGLLCGDCSRSDRRTGERVPRDVTGALRAAASRPPRVAPAQAATAAVGVVDRMLSFHQDRGTLMSERLLAVVTAS